MRISVVIPAYNEAAYIAQAIKSLHNQTFNGRFEIIVVDNNSTDETAQLALRAGAKVIAEPKVGVCAARQTGTQAARGEIVVSTDADTTFDPDWLSTIDAHFTASKDVVAVAGGCRFVHAAWWARVYPRLLFGFVSVFYKLTGRVIYGSATNIAFKKSAFPGYDTTMSQGGDELELLHRLKRKGRVVFDNSNPTYTSARRLSRGMFYSIFVSFFVYYLLEYNLQRLLGRPVFGPCPAFRTNAERRRAIGQRLKAWAPIK